MRHATRDLMEQFLTLLTIDLLPKLLQLDRHRVDRLAEPANLVGGSVGKCCGKVARRNELHSLL